MSPNCPRSVNESRASSSVIRSRYEQHHRIRKIGKKSTKCKKIDCVLDTSIDMHLVFYRVGVVLFH